MKKLFRNRWVRRVGLTLLVVVLLLAVATFSTYQGLRSQGERHQQFVLAELDAADPGWRWESIDATRRKELPPPEKNVIEQAVKLRDRFPKDEYREWSQLPTNDKRRPGELPSADELAHARKLVDICRELIPEARNLRHLSGGVVVPLAENPIMTLLPHVQKPREVALLLQHDALVSAVDGRPDDALDDALAILAMARGLGDEPFLVGQLVRLALDTVAARVVERTLWLGEPSGAKLAEVEAALTAESKASRLVPALRGERAAMNKLAKLLERDPGEAEGLAEFGGGKSPPRAVTAVVVGALLPETHARYLEWMTKAIAVAEKPAGPDRDAEFEKLEQELKDDTSLEGQGLKLVLPAVAKVYQADVRTTALLAAAVAAVRAERERMKSGAFMATFTDASDDPFTAKPLLRKPAADGIVIYSTGADRTDDGGNLTDHSTEKGTDIGVKLLLPLNRRKPPAEEKP